VVIRLGLCCIFLKEPIKFRTTTATYLARIANPRAHIEAIVDHNLTSLERAILYCAAHDIGDFRISSDLLPCATHPDVGYSPAPFANGFDRCREIATAHDIRLTFHPDQFVILNSPREEVVDKAIADIELQADVADRLGADVINIHAGGAYGDKASALERLRRHLDRLSTTARSRLTLENDDRSFTPEDLLSLCTQEGVPFCYDVHHHRCLPDALSVEEATAAAVKTWNREPLFHLSSPKEGWKGPDPRRHADTIHLRDWPGCWNTLNLTVEVEAKGKEVAISSLIGKLRTKNVEVWTHDHRHPTGKSRNS
jgi:UV DNA damage endonuclease